MKLEKIISWLDRTLKVADFDDVSNNGLQVGREEGREKREDVKVVAFAVDASVRAVEAAAKAGAQLLVVHHGISWGGGIRRLTGGVGNVIRAAIERHIAICAYHLPLDAHPTLGNNAQLAKMLGMKGVKPAFSYHGNVIGLVGNCSIVRLFRLFDTLKVPQENQTIEQSEQSNNLQVGICSGGAGEFAEEAKNLGCDLYITGEASWGDVIAAENCGMRMVCAGHYETEVFGVRALAQAMKKELKVKAVDLTEALAEELTRSNCHA